MKEGVDELDYMINELDYEKKGDHISIELDNRKDRIPLLLTREEYNSEIVKTRMVKIITESLLKWDGTPKGAKDLSNRLIGKFLSDNEVEVLRKYRKKNSGSTNRERIKEFYDI